MTDAGIVSVCTLTTVVVNLIYQAFKDQRTRRWEVEDRAAKARLTVAAEDAKAYARMAHEQGISGRDAIVAQGERVLEKIEENTQLSALAFAAGNNFHTKLAKVEAAIGGVMSSHGRRAYDAGVGGAIQSIEQTGQDTNARVRAVEEKVTDAGKG